MGLITDDLVVELQQRVGGDVCRPGDGGYDEAVSIWNARDQPTAVDRRPLRRQRRRRRRAGRSRNARRSRSRCAAAVTTTPGFALTDGGLMIDLTPMKTVTVDAETPPRDVRWRHDVGRARRRDAGARAGDAGRFHQPTRASPG